MISNETIDNSTPDKRGLQIDCLDPSFIILPLPEPQSDSAPMQLFFLVANYAFHTIPYVYGRLSPKLLNSAGQAIQPQELAAPQDINQDYQATVMSPLLYGICIPSKQRIVKSLTATLFWRDNSLHLQVDIFNTFRPTHSQSSWLFADLSPGTYQIQLSYTRPSFAFTLVEEVNVIPFAATEATTTDSAPIELRLVEQSPDNPVIEVEGICFETVVPTQPLLIPPPQSNVRVPVQVELRITNRSAVSYRFSSHVSSLIVDLMGKEGVIPRQQAKGVGGFGLENPIESDFHLIMPGKSISLCATAFLAWQTEGTLALMGRGFLGDSGLGGWVINGLELGRYQIRVTYRSVNEESIATSCVYKDFWCGMVHTPFKKIELAHTQSN